MNISSKTWRSDSPEQTELFAAALATKTPSGTVITLVGDLGAGKTCFVRGFATALKVGHEVSSPTFTIINDYPSVPRLYHIDLYRLQSPDDILNLGFDEYLEPNGITLIEWPERAGDLIPADAIRISLKAGTHTDTDRRTITLSAPSDILEHMASTTTLVEENQPA